jgi:hypothetical protein
VSQRFKDRKDIRKFIEFKLQLMKKDIAIIERLEELLNDKTAQLDDPRIEQIVERAVTVLMGWDRMI